MTNETKGKVYGFNFKRAFIIFFAAFLVFTAITIIRGLSTGGWQEAVEFQNNRMEARLSGDISSVIELRLEEAGRRRGTVGDRALRSFAGFTTRMTSAEFGTFNFMNMFFRIAFLTLAAAFVYTKMQNRGKGKGRNEYQQHSNDA